MFQHLWQRYQPTPQEVQEVIALHQLAVEFRQEQAHRIAFEHYCQHYDQLAHQHQQEHATMQNELNVFALFWRKGKDA